MAIRKIAQIGHPVLRQIARDVGRGELATPAMQVLIDELVETMRDADGAGLAATERAIPIAQEVGVKLSIIELPDGKDPDDIIRADPEAWTKLIQKHIYVVDWVLQTYEKRLDISTSQGKTAPRLQSAGPLWMVPVADTMSDPR